MVSKSDKIRAILDQNHCPQFGSAFSFDKEKGSPSLGLNTASEDLIGIVQSLLKRRGRLYGFLLDLVGPVDSLYQYRRALKRTLRGYDNDAIIINYGSGPRPILSRLDIINIDIYPFSCVDLLVDPGPLPIVAGSVDLVLSIAVLEHVPNPQEMVQEISRILRSGGIVFCFVPFMQPLHSAPGDYQRWTPEGLRSLFSDFNVTQLSPASGPSSSVSWLLATWFASLFSFGNRLLYQALYFVFLPLLSPLKFIDRLAPWTARVSGACSGYFICCTKV